jgi:hypothetical protein
VGNAGAVSVTGAAVEAVEGAAVPGASWTVADLERALVEFEKDHRRICLDPEARNARHTHVKVAEDRRSWLVQQVLVDPDGHNDWMVEVTVDLAASRAAAEPVLRLVRVAAIGS